MTLKKQPRQQNESPTLKLKKTAIISATVIIGAIGIFKLTLQNLLNDTPIFPEKPTTTLTKTHFNKYYPQHKLDIPDYVIDDEKKDIKKKPKKNLLSNTNETTFKEWFRKEIQKQIMEEVTRCFAKNNPNEWGDDAIYFRKTTIDKCGDSQMTNPIKFTYTTDTEDHSTVYVNIKGEKVQRTTVFNDKFCKNNKDIISMEEEGLSEKLAWYKTDFARQFITQASGSYNLLFGNGSFNCNEIKISNDCGDLGIISLYGENTIFFSGEIIRGETSQEIINKIFVILEKKAASFNIRHQKALNWMSQLENMGYTINVLDKKAINDSCKTPIITISHPEYPYLHADILESSEKDEGLTLYLAEIINSHVNTFEEVIKELKRYQENSSSTQ